jgi:hypothetical protein
VRRGERSKGRWVEESQKKNPMDRSKERVRSVCSGAGECGGGRGE